jgi:hypothetical protein
MMSLFLDKNQVEEKGCHRLAKGAWWEGAEIKLRILN